MTLHPVLKPVKLESYFRLVRVKVVGGDASDGLNTHVVLSKGLLVHLQGFLIVTEALLRSKKDISS